MLGVVSGYLQTFEPVYDAGTESKLSYSYNTGIVKAYFINDATDLIHANPIGFKLVIGLAVGGRVDVVFVCIAG